MKITELIKTTEIMGKQFDVYGTFEDPLFLAKDVAKWIDYSKRSDGSYNISILLKPLDDEEKMKIHTTVNNSNGGSDSWFVTEEGLYEILMLSRKPIAKQFKKEVKRTLKELRTTGQVKGNASNMSLLTPTDIAVISEIVSQSVAKTVAALDERMTNIEKKYEERKALFPANPLNAKAHIKQLVNNYSRVTGTDYKITYSKLYSEYNLRYNSSVVRAAKSRKISTLDYIESIGKIEELESLAVELLAS